MGYRVELKRASGRVVVLERPDTAEQTREAARTARQRFPNAAEIIARDAIGQSLLCLRRQNPLGH